MVRSARTVLGCVEFARVFQHPLVEEPPAMSAPAEVRGQYAQLIQRAERACATCPFQQSCLYDAVVHHDVSGFVAGTTARDRDRIRRRLGIRVAPEDFDAIAGATTRNRQVNHDEVLRVRAAYPDDSLNALARRLGCSLSTVKRHLRTGRTSPVRPVATERPRPTMAEVSAAFAEVVRRLPSPKRVAA